eukprot:m.89559 g.89559  ORF g.89559 m.89559 type:complete len:451 (+) comp15227_c0_seq1:136-1488(+)
MGNCVVTGPNEVMVISGGCCSNQKQIVVGGCAWAWWVISDVQRMSLNVITLLPTCKNVETKHGVALTVTGVAQVMVMAEDHMETPASSARERQDRERNRDKFLHKALEQFLGKRPQEIHDTVLRTIEGHLRSILGTLTVDQIYRDRTMFAKHVRDVAAPDLAKMGLEILSFTIKDVSDDVNYLNSLGKPRIAAVIRDADIGKAEAKRDTGIRQAECERERLQAKYDADTSVANAEREFQLLKSSFATEVNQKKAEAELAYALEAAKLKQAIRREEIEIEVVERHRQIEVQEQEVLRKESELIAEINRPAEAEKFRVETMAEAQRKVKVEKALGEAEGIKAIGAAEAFSIKSKGEAEAFAMKSRASAYKSYGDAAVMSMVLESLPKIAAEVAAPLARTKEIVVMGASSGDTAGQVTQLLGTLQPAVQALTGVDIAKSLRTMANNKAGSSTA